MVVTPERKEIELASVVARVAKLRCVLLHTVNLSNHLRDIATADDVSIQTRFKLLDGACRRDEDGPLFAKSGVMVEFFRSEGPVEDGTSPDATIEVCYEAEYLLPAGPVPAMIGDDGLKAFAKLNGLYNCWPYIRQEVDRLGSAMGVPFVLPLLTIEPRRPEEIKVPDQDAVSSVEEKPAKRTRKPRNPK